ncbi:sigma-70 region 4 domain-containing protein [Iningainema tapete]|uniref:Sigma-70 region 4 domain-containing protein n=1 Tax=Iningainema tapete BLCC-T55 TaxID=2748662 RepID=A0A8J6XJ58_9CYAN|nr:sigma-70 region 4 domain-containing protein [Iningainema tapete]MBD2771217.1 sigma-70 region 4 domain-containing protein [Iningainema tapete BLCC-T55]
MDKVTADKLTEIAPSLAAFLELHPDEQKWLYPLLGRAEQRAILILEAMQGAYLSYEEISAKTGTHASTVRQTLYALSSGGLNLKSNKSGKWQSPKGGRSRKLLRME